MVPLTTSQPLLSSQCTSEEFLACLHVFLKFRFNATSTALFRVRLCVTLSARIHSSPSLTFCPVDPAACTPTFTHTLFPLNQHPLHIFPFLVACEDALLAPPLFLRPTFLETERWPGISPSPPSCIPPPLFSLGMLSWFPNGSIVRARATPASGIFCVRRVVFFQGDGGQIVFPPSSLPPSCLPSTFEASPLRLSTCELPIHSFTPQIRSRRDLLLGT